MSKVKIKIHCLTLIICPHWSRRMTHFPHTLAPWTSPSWSSPGGPTLWNAHLSDCYYANHPGPDLEWTVCWVGLAGMSGWDPAANKNSVFVRMDQWEPWSVIIVTCVKCPTTLLVSGRIISISCWVFAAHDDGWWLLPWYHPGQHSQLLRVRVWPRKSPVFPNCAS